MTRTEIINTLAKIFGYKTYLEIGIENPDNNFNKIIIEDKTGIDPDPNAKADFVMTSDKFFKQNEKKFDLIFIDGMHTEEQTLRDIENSLKTLSDGGIIVLHDCNPSTKEMQEVPRKQTEWTGDVWKAFVRTRMKHTDLDMFVIDTDYGVGIIRKSADNDNVFKTDLPLTYENLEKKRKEWLNLVSVKEFKDSIEFYFTFLKDKEDKEDKRGISVKNEDDNYRDFADKINEVLKDIIGEVSEKILVRGNLFGIFFNYDYEFLFKISREKLDDLPDDIFQSKKTENITNSIYFNEVVYQQDTVKDIVNAINDFYRKIYLLRKAVNDFRKEKHKKQGIREYELDIFIEKIILMHDETGNSFNTLIISANGGYNRLILRKNNPEHELYLAFIEKQANKFLDRLETIEKYYPDILHDIKTELKTKKLYKEWENIE